MPMTDAEVDAVLKLALDAKRCAGEATPGPWNSCRNKHPECSGAPWGWVEKSGLNISLAYWSGNRSAQAESNARFAARARTDVPVLANAVESLVAENERLRAFIDRLMDSLESMFLYGEDSRAAQLLKEGGRRWDGCDA